MCRISLALLAVLAPAMAASPELERARGLYDRTHFEQSLQVLGGMAAKDAPAYALMGRDLFMLGDQKKASDALEKAVAADPASAEFALWLGRAYGRRAETANPFSAMGLASKARQCFEKAVALDPRYLEALSDLFEYDVDAPSFMGGGLDKAETIAARMAQLDAAEGYWAQATLAEKRKQYESAGDQLRRAIAASPRSVGRLIDLARFLARRGRVQEAEQVLDGAEHIAPGSPRLMFAKADLYVQEKRNLDTAKSLLKRYLSSELTPDDPPRADAVKLLAQAQGT